MTSLAVLCMRPHGIYRYSVRSISHLSRSTSFTQVSRSRLRLSVRDFALFVIVTVVENDLNFREVGVRLFTILRGFLWTDDTFSHLIDVVACCARRNSGWIAPSILVGAQTYSK